MHGFVAMSERIVHAYVDSHIHTYGQGHTRIHTYIQRRIYSSARRQREGLVSMSERIMQPTPEELQQIYQDWVHIMGELGEEV